MRHHIPLKNRFSKEAFLSLAERCASIDGTCLLFSGSLYSSAKRSFLFLFPVEELSIELSSCSRINPWKQLEKITFSGEKGDLPEWAGFLTYEMGAFADREVLLPIHPLERPLARFFRYSAVAVYDLETGALSAAYSDQSALGYLRLLLEGKRGDPLPIGDVFCRKPFEEKACYAEKIRRAKEYIYRGEIYQVNLSQEALYDTETHPFVVYKRLLEKNPAPFSAYLRLDKSHTIVSSSPERLLSHRDGLLETRPIKGTMARGKSAAEDERNRSLLLSSEKDRAELLMITDLMRNDLCKVSKKGSVEVEKLWHLEEYHNVFHLLSIITAKKRDELSPIETLREVFPGGSITGCPKLRAMEIIYELESSARGIYTGSIGTFSSSGNFDFNIAIRTLDFHKGEVRLRLGGAIVVDSDEEKEYEETLHKGRSIFETLPYLNHALI